VDQLTIVRKLERNVSEATRTELGVAYDTDLGYVPEAGELVCEEDRADVGGKVLDHQAAEVNRARVTTAPAVALLG